jgi:hypothetical protein
MIFIRRVTRSDCWPEPRFARELAQTLRIGVRELESQKDNSKDRDDQSKKAGK